MRSLTALTIALFFVFPTSLTAQESRGVVYDFSATWCGPCQQVAPIVEKLQREGLPIRKVDIDKESALASKFNVQQIPTFVLVIDGQEVDRTTGRLTESDLRRLVARIPTSAPRVASGAAPSRRGRGGMDIPIELGEAAPFSRPEPMETQTQEVAATPEEPRRGLRDLMSFGRRGSEDRQEVVRGNDSTVATSEPPVRTASAATESESSSSESVDPMATSVRIRVVTSGRIDMGSGTVIFSQPGLTQVLTCAHIFKGFNDDSRIEVDVFERGGSTKYIARLKKIDPESDLGLIEFPTDRAIPVARVGGPDDAPAVGTPVAAIGCSGGAEPTRQQSRVTDVDKYEGPHNLLCTGVPVQGRSGGGLFNLQGEIVGVCSAADEQEKRGFYSGLLAIHKLLDECQLTSLYAPPAPAVPETSLAAVEPAAPAATPAVDFPREMPVNHEIQEPAQHPAPATPLDVQAGDAEVVVIIRDRSNPQAPNRVVILHQASPKFLSYLTGELRGDELDTDLMGATNVPQPTLASSAHQSRMPSSQNPFSPMRSVDAGSLRPTTLSQPVVPQRYVRSKANR